MNDEQTNQGSNLPPVGNGTEPPKTPPGTLGGQQTTENVASQANNVMFVGKRGTVSKETGKYETVSIEAPAHVNDGETFIELPSDEEQKKGFYHEKANVLVSLFPEDYKLIVPKG